MTTTVTIEGRQVEAIDLMDKAVAELRVAHQAIDSTLSNCPMGAEVASVLWDALNKLGPVREYINDIHGAA